MTRRKRPAVHVSSRSRRSTVPDEVVAPACQGFPTSAEQGLSVNTTELVEKLAVRLGVSKAEAKRLLSAHLEAIARHLAAGDRVVLRGFGTFDTRHTHAHKGYLPGSAAEALIPGRRRPRFRPSARLRSDFRDPETS